MSTDEKILKAIESLQSNVAAIQSDVQNQGKQLAGLQSDVNGLTTAVKGLREEVGTLELRIEAVHAYQKQAHKEIMDSLFESNEVNSHAQKALEKRVDRIEKHLGLPPLK